MIKLPLKKNKSNSYSVPLPIELIDQLNARADSNILVDLRRFQPTYVRILRSHLEQNVPVSIIYGDKQHPKEVEGLVKEINDYETLIFSKEQDMSVQFPISSIIQINQVDKTSSGE